MKNLKLINRKYFAVEAAIILILLIASFASAQTGFPPLQTMTGNAVSWYDGDTIRFRQSNGKYRRVRIVGIDAPESSQTYGATCKELLKTQTQGITLTLEIVGVDVYRRTLAFVSGRDGVDVGLFMIENGCAWEYSAPLSVRTSYQQAETTARDNAIGLWEDASPIAPVEFRNGGAGRRCN